MLDLDPVCNLNSKPRIELWLSIQLWTLFGSLSCFLHSGQCCTLAAESDPVCPSETDTGIPIHLEYWHTTTIIHLWPKNISSFFFPLPNGSLNESLNCEAFTDRHTFSKPLAAEKLSWWTRHCQRNKSKHFDWRLQLEACWKSVTMATHGKGLNCPHCEHWRWNRH